MLEIVEEQQKVLLFQRYFHALDQEAISRISDVQALRDSGNNKRMIAQVGQRNVADAINKALANILRQLQGQVCFPDATGTRERNEASMRTAQQLARLNQQLFAPDERIPGSRHIPHGF